MALVFKRGKLELDYYLILTFEIQVYCYTGFLEKIFRVIVLFEY